MEGLFAFLAFAVVFYVLMRTGFGWDVVHGAQMIHRANPEEVPGGGPDIDPVCGMRVEPGDGLETTFEGTTFRFCSRNCLRRFETSPSTFAKSPPGGGHGEEVRS